jgi:mono/diheme cytochrome c family protein
VRSLKLVVLCASVALFLIACSSSNSNPTINPGSANSNSTTGKTTATPQPAPVDEFASVRPIYAQRCEVCHGKEANGGTVDIDGKKLKVPSLREGHAVNHTDAQLAKKIANGGDGMPPFKKLLKPEEIDSLVKFIRNDLQKGAAGQKPGEAQSH